MGGTFSRESRPRLAGSYFDFEQEQTTLVRASVGHIVALGITHSWGPANVATEVFSVADFLSKFRGNPSDPTPGFIAVKEAFQGEGTQGFGGAGSCIVYRAVGEDGAAAAITLQNTTPANAITLTGKYPGSLGNDLKVTTQDHAADSDKDELVLLKGTVEVETYIYDDGDVQDLADQINASSSWITAEVLVDSVALADVSAQGLTDGDDGSTLVSDDYTAALEALEVQSFGVLSFENLIDGDILTSIATWAEDQNAAGRRFFLVVGGDTDEAISDANTRSDGLNNPDIINVGVGSVRDDLLKDADGNPVILSTAQLAPRIAGVLANRGDRYSLTFAKLAGLTLINGAAASDFVSAYDHGTVILSRTSDPDAKVKVEKGLTTYTTTGDPSRPKAIFSVPRYVAVMHAIQEELVAWADATIVGRTTVDDETRAAVMAQINELMREKELAGSVQPGWQAFADLDPPPSDDDEFVAFVISAKFGRSTEQVFFSARLS